MSGLMVEYSREIARGLTKVPVVLPGTAVAPGDVVYFNEGRRRNLGIFSSLSPAGAFRYVSSLKDLGIVVQTVGDEAQKSSYLYSTEHDTSVSFGAGAGPLGMHVEFHRKGAVYIAAVNCTTMRLSGYAQITMDPVFREKKMLWRDTYLVTGVTTAERALVMQAAEGGATLGVEGDVQVLRALAPGAIPLDNVELKVSDVRKQSFLLPWDDDSTIFFDLVRFEMDDFAPMAAHPGAVACGAHPTNSGIRAEVDPRSLLEESHA